jgi:hypothetical protein
LDLLAFNFLLLLLLLQQMLVYDHLFLQQINGIVVQQLAEKFLYVWSRTMCMQDTGQPTCIHPPRLYDLKPKQVQSKSKIQVNATAWCHAPKFLLTALRAMPYA